MRAFAAFIGALPTRRRQLDPGAVIRSEPGERHPYMHERLDEEELADWRAGRKMTAVCACLRNTRLPDGSPAVKEDVERYLLGHAGKGAHAGYGKQWIDTLKAAIEIKGHHPKSRALSALSTQSGRLD